MVTIFIQPKQVNNYVRYGVLSSEFVFSMYKARNFGIQFNGYKIGSSSGSIRLFIECGYCVVCGLTGEFFAIEGNPYPHLNFYGYDKNDNEVMLTKDHIIPKSKNGSNNFSNYQTMCKVCNETKQNFELSLVDIADIRQQYENLW